VEEKDLKELINTGFARKCRIEGYFGGLHDVVCDFEMLREKQGDVKLSIEEVIQRINTLGEKALQESR